MKKFSALFLCSFLFFQINAQTIQEIATGAGYQKQSYVNLSAGTEKLVNNTAWHIAFSVFGQQDAAVFINESSGSSMGQALPTVELFDALTEDFNETPDPAILVDFQLRNTEKTWSSGAFNERRDTLDAFDFGWGKYNFATNQVVGNEVYVLKLPSGVFLKMQVVSLIGSTYTFKYANLDGSNLQTKTINKADHAGKTLAYFNLETGAVVDVEPAAGFDLVYCRYITWLFDPGTLTYIPYNVTGILHGRGAQAVKASGINPATVAYADYQNSMSAQLDVIGYDWKAFSGTAWSVATDVAYFLKTANNRVWKLHFIDFEGSTTGKAVFEKTDLGIISAVQDPAAAGMKALVYPNPVQNELNVAIDAPAVLAGKGQIQIFDLQGRLTATQAVTVTEGFQAIQIPATNWMSGTYTMVLKTTGSDIQLGKIVKQ